MSGKGIGEVMGKGRRCSANGNGHRRTDVLSACRNGRCPRNRSEGETFRDGCGARGVVTGCNCDGCRTGADLCAVRIVGNSCCSRLQHLGIRGQCRWVKVSGCVVGVDSRSVDGDVYCGAVVGISCERVLCRCHRQRIRNNRRVVRHGVGLLRTR